MESTFLMSMKTKRLRLDVFGSIEIHCCCHAMIVRHSTLKKDASKPRVVFAFNSASSAPLFSRGGAFGSSYSTCSLASLANHQSIAIQAVSATSFKCTGRSYQYLGLTLKIRVDFVQITKP